MIEMVRHRGPDEHGVFVDREAGLAHARLSIIDLAGGQQPMVTQDGALAITFNGEIFNYLELRDELLAAGHRFATSSDTEVVLECYAEKGTECVHDFNGQWALAIWDARRRELFLSRDRMGIRPLYYTVTNGTLVFASEIKSILVHPAVSRALDRKALDQVFTFWHTIGDRTILEGIHELPPGHCMRFRAGKISTWPYWRLRYDYVNEELTEEAYAGRFLELLVDASRLRLRSDVPVGAYLSGGLDSSVITALINRFSDTPLRTFSVVFEDPEYDESVYQADVIRHLQCEHDETLCTYHDIGRALPEVVWHAEKPIVRAAPAPLYRLSGLVRDHGYKVVLTGEGADEVLGGYDIFKEAKIRRFWGAQPGSLRRPLLLKRLYPYMSNIQALPVAYLKSFFRVRPEDLSSPFFSHLPRWALTARLKTFFSPAVRSGLEGYDACEEYRALLPEGFERWCDFSQAQYLEATGLMPGYILSSQGDRMLMSHSVEGRFPFLDHRVVEFAATIPPRLRMKALDEKHILKIAARDLIPRSIRTRPKQPYRAPDAKSLFSGGGEPSPCEYVRELLSPERISDYGVFHAPAVEKLVQKARRGAVIGARDNMALVGILSTQLVIDQFINRFARRPSDAAD
jgi:asparagine synthase (glutamine-hydrolysing)